MGIPHLISTLEPYATHVALQNNNIVIDGPALAYHILHVCRANGISQPSYRLLGKTIISWLDVLSEQGNSVRAIYFDGDLPYAKRHVRMSRMIKSQYQLQTAFSRTPHGISKRLIAVVDDASVDAFSNNQQFSKSILDPSFFVPAIIDCLQQCSRYNRLTHMVPGEADTYCARDVGTFGGTVLTSDSDLLVHNLGDGTVVFLRDIYKDTSGKLACVAYSLRDLCSRLGLPSSATLTRLAYERSLSHNASLSRLVKSCSRPATDEKNYQIFLQSYQDIGMAISSNETVFLEGLDPRLSEFVCQISGIPEDAKTPCDTIKVFLPILLESPSRGSAWEPTTHIRQLAYNLTAQRRKRFSKHIQEYRRVQAKDQKGRSMEITLSSQTKEVVLYLTSLLERMQNDYKTSQIRYWSWVSLVLDIHGCQESERRSHVLQTLKEAAADRGYADAPVISWDIVHFMAHLQAAFYSLRMLRQICVFVARDTELTPHLQRLQLKLANLPALDDHPQLEECLSILRNANQPSTTKVLSKFVEISHISAKKHQSDQYTIGGKQKKSRTKSSKESSAARTTDKVEQYSTNLFDLLSID